MAIITCTSGWIRRLFASVFYWSPCVHPRPSALPLTEQAPNSSARPARWGILPTLLAGLVAASLLGTLLFLLSDRSAAARVSALSLLVQSALLLAWHTAKSKGGLFLLSLLSKKLMGRVVLVELPRAIVFVHPGLTGAKLRRYRARLLARFRAALAHVPASLRWVVSASCIAAVFGVAWLAHLIGGAITVLHTLGTYAADVLARTTSWALLARLLHVLRQSLARRLESLRSQLRALHRRYRRARLMHARRTAKVIRRRAWRRAGLPHKLPK